MSIWQKRPEAERRLLLAPGGDEDGLLRPHVRDLTSHPSSANYLSHYPKYKISLQRPNQELNSPDLLVAVAVLLHKLVAKRVKGVLKHNRARVPTKNCIGKTISKIKKLKIHLKGNYPKFQQCQHCPQMFPFSVIPSFL